MNCETFTRFDTSSLYKNGRVIAQTSAVFLVRKCQNVDLTMKYQIYCRCRCRIIRIYFNVINTGDTLISNAQLKVKVSPVGCNYQAPSYKYQ